MVKDYSEYIGKKFNKLTILEIFRKVESNRKRVKAKCQCDCGDITIADLYKVLSGHTSSCGCHKNINIKKVKKDLSGKIFGRLLVIERAENIGARVRYLCLCECGNYCIVDSASLKKGVSKSCGCLQSERAKEYHLKHGKTRTRLYRIWYAMKQRCYNANNKSYKNYGGRGITVCDEWKNDFMNFYNWSMANGYDENAKFGDCTIDRIDVNGNYEPSNCKWITLQEQANNTTRNRLVTYNNETHNIKKWSEITKIAYDVILYRLNIGWTMKRIVTTFG